MKSVIKSAAGWVRRGRRTGEAAGDAAASFAEPPSSAGRSFAELSSYDFSNGDLSSIGSAPASAAPSAAAGTLNLGGLVEDYRGGDQAALDELVLRAWSRLQQMARRRLQGSRVRRDADADDLLQRTWAERLQTALAPDRPPVRDTAHFFALAATLIRQTLIDMDRHCGTARGSSNAVLLGVDGEGRSAIDNLEGGFDRLDLGAQADVAAAVGGLPAEEAEIVDLMVVAGLSRAEAADSLGITEAQARTRLNRAKATLAAGLREYGRDAGDA